MGKRLLQLTSVLTGAVMAGAAASPLMDSTEPTAATTTVSAVASPTVSARTLLAQLPVHRESHGSTYSRASFGTWIDADGDCADTRAEVLRAESAAKVTANSRCTVKTGSWTSKYDGAHYTAATYLDIDHLVPLKEAWTSGAWGWSARKRQAFANDLGYGASLIAVSVHANRAKSDEEPTTWLPAVPTYRCAYLRNWIAVKHRWGLAVNTTEKAVLGKGLTTYCRTATSVRVRKPGTPNLTALVGGGSAPAPTSKPTSPPAPTGTDPRYRTCTEAKAAHAHTPYYRGTDPEYAWYTDRDGDGVVCE